MGMRWRYKMMKKRALSGVVVAVLMIALAIALIAIVWIVIDNLVRDRLESVNCIDTLGAVEINSIYTCYDSVNSYFQFSIGIGEINVSSVLVSISGEGTTKSLTITQTPTTIPNLANYGSTNFGTENIVLPGENSGLTYVTDYFGNVPDSISLTPLINGKQCEMSDSSNEIENCLASS